MADTIFTEADGPRVFNQGRDIATRLAMAMDDFEQFAAVFEIRGAAAALGAEYGPPTEGIVSLYNGLAAHLAADNRLQQNRLDLYRLDFG